MSLDLFNFQLNEAVNFFNSFNNKKTIKIVSHHDADGICSAALLIKLLNNFKINYSISIVSVLNSTNINEFAKENYEHYIFSDLGSSYINLINDVFDEKKVLILDHHIINQNIKTKKNICHINPYLSKINASNEISGSGVVYLFCEKLDKSFISLSYLALIGAIGDCQEKKGFNGINLDLLKKSKKNNLINHFKGIKIIGSYSKPIVKFIKQSIDPLIPELSGDEVKTINFLRKINIEPIKNKKYKTLFDLNDEEKSKLIIELSKLIPKSKKKNLIGDVYLINSQTGPYKDIREFSTILNSCGRLNKSTIGIGACLNDNKMKKKALELLNEYKKEILDMIKWFKENKNTKLIIESNNFIIINCKNFIAPNMIGIFASIISYSNMINKNKFVLTMSRNDDNTTKISLRYSNKQDNVNLYEIISKITKMVNGEFGGHKNAAGAIINTNLEEQFITKAQELFKNLSIQEKIE